MSVFGNARATVAAVIVVGVVIAWIAVRARSRPGTTVAATSRDAIVPRVAHGPNVDGELDDDIWAGSLRSGAFKGQDGQPARPHSEARFLWGEGQLFVGLYAADEDVEAPVTDADGPVWLGDAFQLSLRTAGEVFRLDVSPKGTLTDARALSGGPFDYAWSSRARVASDVDGTVNDSRDRDEEWVIEMAIPLASLHLEGREGERVDLSVRRCDQLRSGGRSCGEWGADDAPIVLVLGDESTPRNTRSAAAR